MNLILIAGLFVLIGGLLMRGLFAMKGRNTANGAILGGILGLFPPALIVALVIVLIFVPRAPEPEEAEPDAESKYQGSMASLETRLKELDNLKKQNLVTDEEYQQLRSKALETA